MEKQKIEQLKKMVQKANKIVFITGAGISRASGIPDIRGKDGLSNRIDKEKQYGASYEEIVSHEYFLYNTKNFFRYYFNEMIFENALPNKTHKALARLNDKAFVITQNIDSLHTLAGTTNIVEFHGSVNRNYCLGCHAFYNLKDLKKLLNKDGVPICPKCGKIIKPDVVLFNESLDESDIDLALTKISNADLLIVIGSSLVVNPAASLPYYFRGKNFVIINKEPTPLDANANLIIRDNVEDFIEDVID